MRLTIACRQEAHAETNSAIIWYESMSINSDNPGGLMMAIIDFEAWLGQRQFATILADPPWQFQNSTGKIAPEHRRLARYGTMKVGDIKRLPVQKAAGDPAHLYLWVPNALLSE